jgi:hypothetical protein
VQRSVALDTGQTVAAEESDSQDQEGARALLDDPRLRWVFFVTDQVGQPAQETITSLMAESTHHDYYRITIAQGIAIDPRHPDRATVFAAAIDESHFGTFRNRLKEAFKERLQQEDVDPVVVTQLADIGQVVSFSPHPIGDVVIPPSRLALRERADQPTLEQERSSPAGELAHAALRGTQPTETAVGTAKAPNRPAEQAADSPTPDSAPRLTQLEPLKKKDRPPGAPRHLDLPRPGGPSSRNDSVVVLVWILPALSG